MREETSISVFFCVKKAKKGTSRATHAALSMRRRPGCDSLDVNACAKRLPKQQLRADGSVLLIRRLQLWMVHSNQDMRHPLAKAAYHTEAGDRQKMTRWSEEAKKENMSELY